MRKLFWLLFLLPTTALSCTGYVIGFKGLNDRFDHKAFDSYSDKKGLCSKSFSWTDIGLARKFVINTPVPYHLYGYSKGAESIRQFLNYDIRKPDSVITIGAYRTTDVNFDRHNVQYVNYFDISGKGQTSPGIFVNVSHDKIQQKVNEIIWGQ